MTKRAGQIRGDPILHFFLHAKHWQIFILLLAAPLYVLSGNRFLYLLAVLTEFIYFGWLWSVGSFLARITNQGINLKIGLFRSVLVCMALWFCSAIVIFQNKIAFPSLFLKIVALFFIPLNLAASIGLFYVLYFVSKKLVFVESGNPASIRDYAGTFVLVWFFPLGVWFVQPRINRLYELAGKSAVRTPMLESPE